MRRRFRHHRPGPVRRADPDLRHRRRPAGGDDRAGLLRARHGEVDLRHRLLRAAEYRRRRRSSPATGCSRPSPTSSTASAPTRWKARSSSPAPRCNGCATGCRSSPRRPRPARWRRAPIRPSRSFWCRPLSAWARPIGTRLRGALFGLTRSTGRANSRARRWKRLLPDRAICSRRCTPTGRGASASTCCASTAAWPLPTGPCSASPISRRHRRSPADPGNHRARRRLSRRACTAASARSRTASRPLAIAAAVQAADGRGERARKLDAWSSAVRRLLYVPDLMAAQRAPHAAALEWILLGALRKLLEA